MLCTAGRVLLLQPPSLDCSVASSPSSPSLPKSSSSPSKLDHHKSLTALQLFRFMPALRSKRPPCPARAPCAGRSLGTLQLSPTGNGGGAELAPPRTLQGSGFWLSHCAPQYWCFAATRSGSTCPRTGNVSAVTYVQAVPALHHPSGTAVGK